MGQVVERWAYDGAINENNEKSTIIVVIIILSTGKWVHNKCVYGCSTVHASGVSISGVSLVTIELFFRFRSCAFT